MVQTLGVQQPSYPDTSEFDRTAFLKYLERQDYHSKESDISLEKRVE
jgi:hypothetical protein